MRLAQIFTVATVALVLAAGCSGAPASAGPEASSPAASTAARSVETSSDPASAATGPSTAADSLSAQCLALTDAMDQNAQALNDAMAELAKDPNKAIKALESFADSFEKEAGKVTNPDLKAQADKAVTALHEMNKALKAVIEDPSRADAATKAVETFETETTAIGTVCSGADH